MTRQSLLAQNLQTVLAELKGSANLVAVSKTRPFGDVKALYQAGQLDFGENKVQELLGKAGELEAACPNLRWHFIGRLQSNKINQLLRVPNLVSIHSIDSLSLLEKLLSKSPPQRIGLFLQFNASEEAAKGGFETYEELLQAAKLCLEGESFYLQGLMTMGSIRSEDFAASAKECFERLKSLRQCLQTDLKLKDLQLSMGMSSDYSIALDVGTDWVRVGTKLFGPRQP